MAIRSGGRFGTPRRVGQRARGSRRRRWPATRAATSRSPGSTTAASTTIASTSRCAGRATRSGSRSGSPRGRVRSVSAAIGSRGDVLVAWNTRRQGPHAAQAPRARVRPRGDAAVRPRVGRPAARRGRELRPRLRRLGLAGACSRAATAGRPTTTSRCARPAPRASAARSGSTGSRANHLGGPLDLTLTGRGNALVAWVSDRVRVAETGADGRFGAPRDLSAPARPRRRGSAASTPPRPRRRAAGDLDGGRPARAAAFGAPGATLGPPEDVAPGETPRAAFPGPNVGAGRLRRPDGVHVQEATRAG